LTEFLFWPENAQSCRDSLPELQIVRDFPIALKFFKENGGKIPESPTVDKFSIYYNGAGAFVAWICPVAA
jgi:hypothetical protein